MEHDQRPAVDVFSRLWAIATHSPGCIASQSI
jgi:hypothetical protein